VPPNRDSVRLIAVVTNGPELLRIADVLEANRIALCGSVARGVDTNDSDIDFFVHDFLDPDSLGGAKRANRLVRTYRSVLKPFGVDILGIPGFLVGPEQETSMRRDSIDLRDLVATHQ
jgi:hypothetical protein